MDTSNPREKSQKSVPGTLDEQRNADSSKMDAVIQDFRQERDRRNRVEDETTSWHLKLLLPCLIVIAALDLAVILGYLRPSGMRDGTGAGIGLLVFALVTLFVLRYRKNR